MELLGENIENFSLPICTKFKPKLLNGQLCYNVDMGDIKSISQGPAGGFKFLMDYNKDRMIRKIERMDSQISLEGLSELGGKVQGKEHEAKIYFDLLEPSVMFGPGDFVMTSVKEFIGTDQYLKWADGSSCQNKETISQCQSNSFLQNTKVCGCRPFGFDSIMKDKVI